MMDILQIFFLNLLCLVWSLKIPVALISFMKYVCYILICHYWLQNPKYEAFNLSVHATTSYLHDLQMVDALILFVLCMTWRFRMFVFCHYHLFFFLFFSCLNFCSYNQSISVCCDKIVKPIEVRVKEVVRTNFSLLFWSIHESCHRA